MGMRPSGLWKFWLRARDRGKVKTAGRVPQDALLFIQTAIKSKQKGPFSCGGHGIREGRRVLLPGPQLSWQRLQTTERQRPQLNKFRWAGLFRRRFVGRGSGNDEVGLLKLPRPVSWF